MVSYHGALINFFIVNEIHLSGSPKLWYQLTLRTIKTGHPKYTFGHFTVLIIRMTKKKQKPCDIDVEFKAGEDLR